MGIYEHFFPIYVYMLIKIKNCKEDIFFPFQGNKKRKNRNTIYSDETRSFIYTLYLKANINESKTNILKVHQFLRKQLQLVN